MNQPAYHSVAPHSGYGLHQLPLRSDPPLSRYDRFCKKHLAFLAWKIAYLLHFYCVWWVSFDVWQSIRKMIDIHLGYKTRLCSPSLVPPTTRSGRKSEHTLFSKRNSNLITASVVSFINRWLFYAIVIDRLKGYRLCINCRKPWRNHWDIMVVTKAKLVLSSKLRIYST